jgi:hypothetical protein
MYKDYESAYDWEYTEEQQEYADRQAEALIDTYQEEKEKYDENN